MSSVLYLLYAFNLKKAYVLSESVEHFLFIFLCFFFPGNRYLLDNNIDYVKRSDGNLKNVAHGSLVAVVGTLSLTGKYSDTQ